jgi:hypothetical protein
VPKNKPAKKKPETKKPEPIKNRTSAREVPTGTRTRVKGGYKGATPIKKMSTRATPRTQPQATKGVAKPSTAGKTLGKVARAGARGGAVTLLAAAGAMAAKTAYDYHKVTTGSQVTSPKPEVRAFASHYEKTYRAKNEGVIKKTVAKRVKKEKARRRNAAP